MRISRKSSGWKLPLYTWRNSGRHPAGRLGFFHDRAGLSKYLTQTFMSHGNEMICQPVTLSGYAEWPKVADAVIEAARPPQNVVWKFFDLSDARCNTLPPKWVQNVAADLLGVETLAGSVSPPRLALVSQ